ncbi:MAG: inositol monophosphatase [Deltaproteobacteria bacterium]|nr:inositol monophosphatase [Deltaproteobacteria bacterium]
MSIRDTAVMAAERAGELLRKNLGRAASLGRVEFKGAVDIVTRMDRRAEALIVSTIRKNFPDHGILTEESAERVTGSRYRWIVDPLDGTTNYAHGFPIFCVSIAFEEDGEVIFGAVYGPMLNELFVAEKGRGASMNGRRIRVSKTFVLDRSLLATGFPYDVRTSSDNNLGHFANFAVRAQAIRRAGSAALDLSYVACGRFDGFWEIRLKPWDVAAAALMVKEAGGTVTDFKGLAASISSGDILATNGAIHAGMIEVLNIGKGFSSGGGRTRRGKGHSYPSAR